MITLVGHDHNNVMIQKEGVVDLEAAGDELEEGEVKEMNWRRVKMKEMSNRSGWRHL